ncbi:MerR family DNA-binding transcriptional regulator [Gorillibacterium massiliense]|uniref:MerR family DNA-binding transcriptional regulator n=1 Tax=Gorillibacterium massiliense TaxID=1280390 RepID=UPI0004B6EA8F|nr:MerR family DNA-binding transcriptional regulator [Gorillibacterium massiliense]
MKIGELSKRTGVSIRSLRYYEEKGLIASIRLENGYRDYSSMSAEQVDTIRFYLSLGLTTEEIAGFLQCVMMNKEAFCKEILPVYKKKLTEIDQQLQLLTQLKSNLEDRVKSILQENQSTEEEKS